MEKYLIASSGNTIDSRISGRFGHSGYFLKVDPVSMEYEAFPGVSNYEDQIIPKFIETDITKVIVGNIGPALYNEVIAYGCRVYLCRNMPVPEAIKKVKNGDIPALKGPTLKESIHSGRKTGYNFGGRGKGSISRMAQIRGSGRGRSTGGSRTAGKTYGKGRGR